MYLLHQCFHEYADFADFAAIAAGSVQRPLRKLIAIVRFVSSKFKNFDEVLRLTDEEQALLWGAIESWEAHPQSSTLAQLRNTVGPAARWTWKFSTMGIDKFRLEAGESMDSVAHAKQFTQIFLLQF